MTIREYIGDEQADKLHDRIDDLLNSEEGFLFIGTPKSDNTGFKVTDLYKDICAEHVLENVKAMVSDAVRIGLVHTSGHKHA